MKRPPRRRAGVASHPPRGAALRSYPFEAAFRVADAIGIRAEVCFGVDEIWATKAPRTMAREATTNRSFQPVALETLKRIDLRVWVVMTFSVFRQGFESLSLEWRARPGRCDS